MINRLKTSPSIQLTLSQIISLVFSFVSSIIIANSLGLEKFGIFIFLYQLNIYCLLFFLQSNHIKKDVNARK